ncbi:hypothetical protein MPSI1_000055 [Malassezia psittaci]|uniref:Xylanolytic transcriptional activator regulatory domain-containing protein n=1 Tax=Malassezia psittaci TaxID=1821823 RepID=A0AAF0JCC2_9BASI|nr:hypothetical protein MPSI1_000055 [Malassezia psittaci]
MVGGAQLESAQQGSSVADVVSAALSEPPRRKRQIPCQPCIDRGTADLCHPYGEGDEYGNLHERVRRLEVLVHGLASEHKNVERHLVSLQDESKLLGSRSFTGTPEMSHDTVSESEEPSMLYGMEREELKRLEHGHEKKERKPLNESLSDQGSSYFGELALPSISQRTVRAEVDGEAVEVQSAIPRSPASHMVRRLVGEGGAPPGIVRSLMEMLPSQEDCNYLIKTYFKELNYIVFPLHERGYRMLFDELMQFRFGEAFSKNPSEGARLIPFLTSFFFLCAHSALALPQENCPDHEAVKKALHYFHAGSRALNIASFIRADHIDLVLANLLASKFCITMRRTTPVWMYIGAAIRGAQSMGLHRDGKKLGLDQVTTERRRRLWANLYHWDKAVSILVARPSAIQDAHCDTLAPSEIALEDLDSTAPAHSPIRHTDGKPPSLFAFFSVRYELGRLMGQIGDLYQDLRAPVRYEDVLRLDAQLAKFRESLPSFLRTPDQPGADFSMDKQFEFIVFHRYLIHVELNFTRITLHRPYVLKSESKYQKSRQIAFQTARSDMVVRQAFEKIVPFHTRTRQCKLGGMYRLFNTMLIHGIMLLLEPDPQRVADSKAILEDFVKGYESRSDLNTRREVAIVRMFLAKAEEYRLASKSGRNSNHSTRQSRSSAAPDTKRGSQKSSSTSDSCLSWDGNEPAQSFLTNLGGFNKNLSLFPPGLTNELPLQHDNTYLAAPMSLDINGLDLLGMPADAPQPVDGTPFDQRLALYDSDAFGFNGIDYTPYATSQPQSILTPTNPTNSAVNAMPSTTAAHADYMPGISNRVPTNQELNAALQQNDTGIMPWGGFINAIIPQSP